ARLSPSRHSSPRPPRRRHISSINIPRRNRRPISRRGRPRPHSRRSRRPTSRRGRPPPHSQLRRSPSRPGRRTPRHPRSPLDPREGEFLNDRGAAYHAKGDLERAIADYDQAIRLNPKLAEPYNNRGSAYQRKGDFARASSDYGEVTKLQPNNLDAWVARCWV